MAVIVALAGLRSSRHFHMRFVTTIVKTPLEFYETTPLGRIMNRCTNDLSVLDLIIPFTVRSMANSVLKTCTAVFIASIVSWWMFVFVLPLIVTYLAVQVYCFAIVF